MKKLATLLLLTSVLFAEAQNMGPNLGIIPAPAVIIRNSGSFTLTTATRIKTDLGNNKTIDFLTAYLRNEWDLKLADSNADAPTTIFLTSEGATLLPAEGYKLTITTKQITITGKDAGLFYGVQSLIQLLPPVKSTTVNIPCATMVSNIVFNVNAVRFSYSV